MIHPRHLFDQHGQGQVFRFFDDLPADKQDALTRQAASIDLDEIDQLVKTLVKKNAPTKSPDADPEPADYIPVLSKNQNGEAWQKATKTGEQALRNGRVAAFTVAGGQGTRLGFDGPKGTFPISPVSEKSLFQIFAEKIKNSGERYQCSIPWFIMTSLQNHDETSAFFRDHSFFGLDPESLHLFPQGTIPIVDQEGKILLNDKHNIAMSPDGHGGSLRALVRSGATRWMEEKGIDLLSCFQVDNPLVKCIDPAFIGFHLNKDSQLSSKIIVKKDPDEKVGVFCKKGEHTQVIEYSDLAQELQQQTDPDGALRFRAGSIAVHIFHRELVEKLGGNSGEGNLPFHVAHKKNSSLDENGQLVEAPAIKFEMFIFDALPFAENPLILEALRESEFSPVKNARGSDSPESSRNDQLRQFARWFKANGINLNTDGNGIPEIKIEVSPQFADTKERFTEAWKSLSPQPEIKNGLVVE
ncbi:MAG: UDPGP type 1 family protein [Verrucomicrobiota bacterium]